MARDPQEEKTLRERIGTVVEARRVLRGLSEVALANEAGVDDRQMHRVLHGQSGLSIYSLNRVARALGWTLGELMYVAFPPTKGRRPLPRRTAARLVRSAARDSAGELPHRPA